jgi:hypothetical protein
VLRIGISYLICAPVQSHAMLMACWDCFANGKEASSSSWSSHMPFSSSCCIGWFVIVDAWDWSPLAVNEASHDPSGEEVGMPSLSCTISIVGPKRPLWFCLRGINSEVLNCSPCSLGLQQVLSKSHPFPPLILMLALLYYL